MSMIWVMSSVRNLFTIISVVVVIFFLGYFMLRSSSPSKASNSIASKPTPTLPTTPTNQEVSDDEPIPLSFEVGAFVESVATPTGTSAPTPTPISQPDKLIADHLPHSGPGYTIGKRDMIRSNGQSYIEIDMLTDGTKPVEEVIADFQSWIKTFGITPADLKKVKVAVIKP